MPPHSSHVFCPLQTANGPNLEEEISLMDCWRVVWPRRKLIAILTTVTALLTLLISLTIPDTYRAEVLLAPVSNEEGNGGLSSALGNLSGLGGLVSMAGVTLPSGGNTEENLAVLKSRDFLGKFVKGKELLPILFADEWDQQNKRWKANDPKKQPGTWDAYRLLTEDLLMVSLDKRTSLVTVSIDWTDPQLAASWANELITRLNDYLRKQAIARSNKNLNYLNEALALTQITEMRQTLFTLIAEQQKNAMLANTQEEFAFRVIDQATTPDEKHKPHRSVIVVLATFIGLFLSLVLVFFIHWLHILKEPLKNSTC